jgi:hypothetical protein
MDLGYIPDSLLMLDEVENAEEIDMRRKPFVRMIGRDHRCSHADYGGEPDWTRKLTVSGSWIYYFAIFKVQLEILCSGGRRK